ncbi:MAG TPA: substrate-binding domain-containing protein, partial [Anaeromyxobacteraceae bacterium]|nr:substrate-binding domain-containing protein [Anaeromyxobacteraceae bacterium]
MMKSLLALFAALALPASALAGGTQVAAAGGPILIGMSVPGLQFPFFVTMKNDAEQAAAKLGAKIVFADAQDNSEKQAADVENFVAQGVQAILISPKTTDSLVPAIEAAVKAGIPVATVDRKANTDKVLVHVGADNVQGGRAAAKFIIDQLKNKGTVIELEGTPGASAATDRKAGFDEVMKKSNVKIIVSQTAEFSRAKGQSVMESLLQKY